MILTALALVLQPTGTAPAPPAEPTIIVTGQRISDLRAALAACLARGCPPNEDVDATLALAEGMFLNGDYPEAETAIKRSLGRNRRHAARHPEPVADLFRALARVQYHQGRDHQATFSIHRILEVLKEGLRREDHRHFTARLEIVDALSRAGQPRALRRQLRELIVHAKEAGRQDIVRWAEMRLLRSDYALQTGHNGPALKRLEALARSNDPSQQFERASSRLFLARLYRDRGETARSDEMLAGLPKSNAVRRRLLYAPAVRFKEPYAPTGDSGDQDLRRPSSSFEDTWIDVAYFIEADGRVSDVEVVRSGANTRWARPLIASIRARRYSALTEGAPTYRLERYTYTAPWIRGAAIPTRSSDVRVEVLDLTPVADSGGAAEAAVPPGHPD